MSGLETIAMIGGSLLSAAGTIAGGAAAARNDKAKAMEMERKATEERALATREAIDKRREAELIQSKQMAGAAASGGSTTDATMLDIFSDTEAQGAYNSASAIYKGEASARNLEAGAANARASSRTRMPGAIISAGGSLLGDFGRNAKSYGKLFD